MSNTEVISSKVSEDVKKRLAEIQQKTGKTESELIRGIILEYLGKVDPTSIDSMLSRLEAVERKCIAAANTIRT